MFSRNTTGQGVGRLVESLQTYLLIHGATSSPNTVSGRPTSEDVNSIHNVMFEIGQPISQTDLDSMIIDAHGEAGLRFLLVEGKEWFDDYYVNPGEAWKEDFDRWKPLLNEHGEMDYSYNSRINTWHGIDNVVAELSMNSDTRRAYLPIFSASDTPSITLETMIPCIIGYQFSIDKYDKIDVAVMLRSCDIGNCLRNDIWLAHNLLKHIVSKVEGTSVGGITFYIANLHKYSPIKSK